MWRVCSARGVCTEEAMVIRKQIQPGQDSNRRILGGKASTLPEGGSIDWLARLLVLDQKEQVGHRYACRDQEAVDGGRRLVTADIPKFPFRPTLTQKVPLPSATCLLVLGEVR